MELAPVAIGFSAEPPNAVLTRVAALQRAGNPSASTLRPRNFNNVTDEKSPIEPQTGIGEYHQSAGNEQAFLKAQGFRQIQFAVLRGQRDELGGGYSSRASPNLS
jgi:hypothetical protein